MKSYTLCALAALTFCLGSAYAAAPSDAPSGSTGMCKDGSYSSAAEKKGACRGHKGVQTWYDEGAAAAPAVSERAAMPPPSLTAAPSPATMAKPATSVAPTAMAGRTSSTATQQPATGGGDGKVWANTSTKVYHCSGDKYYGTTKHGEYMSESDAKSKGYHADHGKACA